MKRVMIALVISSLLGCAAQFDVLRDDHGQITGARSNKQGQYHYKGPDGEIELNTKFESPIKEIVSINGLRQEAE